MAHNLVFRVHVIQRMFERNITPDDVRTLVETGEVIKEYPDDKPYPSRLLLGWSGTRPLHVVAADNTQEDQIIIITAYEPDPKIWETDFKRKKPQ
jgi:hypothetical protein